MIIDAERYQNFWFEKFLEISRLSKDDYCISNGMVYKIDTERKKAYDEEQKIPYAFRRIYQRQE